MLKKIMQKSQKVNLLMLACLPFLLYITGCTSTAVYTDPEGKKWIAKLSGNAESSMKTKDLEMKIKRKPMIETPQVGDIKLIRKED